MFSFRLKLFGTKLINFYATVIIFNVEIWQVTGGGGRGGSREFIVPWSDSSLDSASFPRCMAQGPF